jgi:hydroxymethylpyrimidine pyrophosphatase-like HAD family hydrolase
LILVTGRELADLFKVFPHRDLFDRIVAENGASLYRPATGEECVLAKPPPRTFVDLLRERGVAPLSVGRTIVATTEPNETLVLRAIRDLGLELQVVFNKGSVMVLPSGVNKATGLAAALKELGLSRHNTVALGDAENDHAFLQMCEASVAVANAVPSLKELADEVTRQDHGSGAVELVGQLLHDDLLSLAPRLVRHNVLFGVTGEHDELRINPFDTRLLVAGEMDGPKLTLVNGFLKRLCDQGYQSCIVDSEARYFPLNRAVLFGGSTKPTPVDAVLHALDQAQENALVDLQGTKRADRPGLLQRLLPGLLTLSSRTGRPHWTILAQAHELLSASVQPGLSAPSDLSNLLLVTVEPETVARAFLAVINIVVLVGKAPAEALSRFCHAAGRNVPAIPPLSEGAEALGWRCGEAKAFWLRTVPPGPAPQDGSADQSTSTPAQAQATTA